jgi:hypothetical protein
LVRRNELTLCAKRRHSHRSKIFLFDHLVGDRKRRWQHRHSERFGGSSLMTSSNLVAAKCAFAWGWSPEQLANDDPEDHAAFKGFPPKAAARESGGCLGDRPNA